MSDSQNVRNEASGGLSDETAEKYGPEGEMKNAVEETASAEKFTKEIPSKKMHPKSSQRKKKSKYPIDDYLSQYSSSNKDEVFPLPSLSPPPSSPSHKAVRKAEDLLEAAEQFLLNINLDLSVRSRPPSESPQGPEETPSLCSSLSEETNPLIMKKIVNAALGNIEAKVKAHVHFSTKSHLMVGQDTAENSTPGTKTTSGSKEYFTVPCNEDGADLETANMSKRSSKHSTNDINLNLRQVRENVEHAFALAQQVNRNLRPDGTSRRIPRQLASIASRPAMLIKHPPKYSSSSMKQMPISSTSSSSSSSFAKFPLISSGCKPPPNSPNVSKQNIPKSGVRRIKNDMEKVSHLPKTLQRVHPQNYYDQDEDESISSETTSEVTVNARSTASSASRAVRSNLKPTTKAVDVGVNTSYSLLTDMMDVVSDEIQTKEILNEKKSTRSVKFLLDEQKQGSSRQPSPFVEDSLNAIAQAKNVKASVGFEDSCSNDLINHSQAVKELHAPNSDFKVNSNFNFSKIVVLPQEETIEEKLQEEMIIQSSIDEEAQNVGYNHLSGEIARKDLKVSTEEDTNIHMDLTSLSDIIESILVNEVKKVADEARNSKSRPIQEFQNVERVERSILEVVEALSPVSSREASKGKESPTPQIDLTPEPFEEDMEKLIYLEEELERVFTPPRTPSPVDLVDPGLEYSEQKDDLSVVETPPLSPPSMEDKFNEPEDDVLVEVKTPPTTPAKIAKLPETSQKSEIYEEHIFSLQTPSTTPRSTVKDDNPEEALITIQPLDSVSTPPPISVSPRLEASENEQWTSSSDQAKSKTGETPKSLSLPFDKPKIFNPKLYEFSAPLKIKTIDTPKTYSTSKESFPSNQASSPKEIQTTVHPSIDELMPFSVPQNEMEHEDELPVSDHTLDQLQNVSMPINHDPSKQSLPVVKQSLTRFSQQDPDITTATSISMEPEDELSFTEDEPRASLSEGEVKIREMPNLRILNLDPLSEGEVPAEKIVKPRHPLSRYNVTESNNLPVISAICPKNLTATWSEGEIKNRWVLLHAYGSSSTSIDDTKSFGEISPLVLGSLHSEGEISIDESNNVQLRPS